GGACGCCPHGLPFPSDAALDLDRNTRRTDRELAVWADDSPGDEGPRQAQGHRPRNWIKDPGAIEVRRRHDEEVRANGPLANHVVERAHPDPSVVGTRRHPHTE